jgi:hypothetical protein
MHIKVVLEVALPLPGNKKVLTRAGPTDKQSSRFAASSQAVEPSILGMSDTTLANRWRAQPFTSIRVRKFSICAGPARKPDY